MVFKINFNKKNKRGFIRIVEAFVAILLVTGVLLVVINKGYIGGENISQKVYGIELSMLREMELDGEIREGLLLPIEERDDSFLDEEAVRKIEEIISSRKPDFLECQEKICPLEKTCELESVPEGKDIYAQAVAITANLENYKPTQIKIFCWEK